MVLYTNRLSTKEADNVLQTAMRNLQREIRNLKAEVVSLNKSDHSDGAGAANKDNSRFLPNWKREG